MEWYTEAQVVELCSGPNFKQFLRKKCGECGGAGFRVKYAKTSPMIVRSQVSTFWCRDCGRLLCEQHRHAHACERVDARLARARAMSPEEIRDAARREEQERETMRLEAEARAREAKTAAAAAYQAWRTHRREMAGLSSRVANFVQRIAREDGQLLATYTACNRINLRLWNQVDHPTAGKLDVEAWDELRGLYKHACDVSGLVLTVDGVPLDLPSAVVL